MATIREMITKWGFEAKTDGLEKVEHHLEKIQSRLEFLAAVEVVKGLFELTEKFAKFAEELHVAAESAGITVEAFQKLAFAASQSAVTQDEMGMAMARLSRHLYQARMGSKEAQIAFANAGFTPAQVAGFHTGQDALLGLADRFKDIHDPIQKQALAMELLGRGSVNMVGFLSKGSSAIKGLGNEAERLGIVLSHNQVEALVKVEHAMLELWGIFKAFGATIASYFAPSLETAIHEITNFWAANKKLINLEVKKWVWDITYALGAIWAAVKFVTQAFLNWAVAHEEIVRYGGEVLLFLGALITLISTLLPILNFLSVGFNVLLGAVSPLGIAIALLVIAIHDLWNATHGRPTWIETFLEFLGIAKDVNMYFQSIFEILDGIAHLDLAKVWDGMKGVGESLFNLSPVGMLYHGAQKLAGVGETPGNIAGASSAPNIGGVQVNSPMTFNIAAGSAASPGDITKEVSRIVRDHFDRTHRESARSLRGVVAQ